MTPETNDRPSIFRRVLIRYLSYVPLGLWPEFCAQTRAGRRRLLASRSLSELMRQLVRTHFWQLRYVFHFVTSPIRRKPSFFIMGFPKCGTTYFADRLTLRKDVASATGLATIGKETLHYRKDQVMHARMPIRGFFPIFTRASQLFDASVSYSYDPGAMAWIRRDYPGVKIILVVRDQVSAYESMVNYYSAGIWRNDVDRLRHFNNASVFRKIDMKLIDKAIDITARRECSSTITMRSRQVRDLFGERAELYSRIAHLRYDRWVTMHLRKFGIANVLIHDFSDLINEPERIVSETAEFLGLPPDDPVDHVVTIRELKKNASRKVFRLEPDTRQALQDTFIPYNRQLLASTGVDLNQHFETLGTQQLVEKSS